MEEGDTSVKGEPTLIALSLLFFQGSPWVSRSERRDGRNGTTGETGGVQTGLHEGSFSRENDKGAGGMLALVAFLRE